MKQILVTGSNSYIGISFEKWLANMQDKYSVSTIDMKSNVWKESNFSRFDTVLHVAGIAHIKETTKNQGLYYKVNRDLAYETALKAKIEGVKQFIFISSMSVYGIDQGVIDKNTMLNPKSNYGKSKLQAEELIVSLADDNFQVAILRPPMIYGKGCKGNYPRLATLAKKLPIFPDIQNKRSMIYIDNLCEFLRLIVEDYSSGLFFPQNEEYVCTAEMVKVISQVHGKKMQLTKAFNPLLKILKVKTIHKVFGDLVYDISLSNYEDTSKINFIGFKESIELTEI